MRPGNLVALAIAISCISIAPLIAQEADPVRVVNFPEVQSVAGTVEMTTPATNTELRSISESVVAPIAPDDTANLVLAGTLDAHGFRSAIFSLAGQVKSNYPAGGAVGALLVPNTPFFQRAFEEDGEALLALRLEGVIVAGQSGAFATSMPRRDLAFPSYRVYFFNTSDQPSSAILYAYLAN